MDFMLRSMRDNGFPLHKATETESGFIVHAVKKHPTKIQKNFNFLAHLPFQTELLFFSLDCIQHRKET
jgi:hypothetical protein